MKRRSGDDFLTFSFSTDENDANTCELWKEHENCHEIMRTWKNFLHKINAKHSPFYLNKEFTKLSGDNPPACVWSDVWHTFLRKHFLREKIFFLQTRWEKCTGRHAFWKLLWSNVRGAGEWRHLWRFVRKSSQMTSFAILPAATKRSTRNHWRKTEINECVHFYCLTWR